MQQYWLRTHKEVMKHITYLFSKTENKSWLPRFTYNALQSGITSCLYIYIYIYSASIKTWKNSQAQSHFAHFFLHIKELSTSYILLTNNRNLSPHLVPQPTVQKLPMLSLPLLILCNKLHYLLFKKPTICTYKTYKIYTYIFPSCMFRQMTAMIKE
jgi:hypothetical protein